METFELYEEACDDNIQVMLIDIPENGSMCVQTDCRCYIGMDFGVLENEASRRVHLAHELGHCKTGAFYNRYAACDVRKRHENRADKWAIAKLVPANALTVAIKEGCTESWELAERFNVTEDFIKKAMCFYVNGNLASDLYF